MSTGHYEFPQSDFLKRFLAEAEARSEAEGRAQGRAQGRAESLVRILDVRQFELSSKQRETILQCRDIDVLESRLARAVTADTAADVLKH